MEVHVVRLKNSGLVCVQARPSAGPYDAGPCDLLERTGIEEGGEGELCEEGGECGRGLKVP